MGDKQLIKDLKSNKEEAYIELINLYGNRLARTLFLMTKDKAEAEDIVQETFIRVFKYIKNFRGNSSIYTWIYRISQNIAKDRFAAKNNSTAYEDSIELSQDNIEEIIITGIDREILRMEIDRLKFLYKQVIVLFYFEDLTIREISEILEEKETTIRSKLHRGRKLLKKALQEGGRLNG